MKMAAESTRDHTRLLRMTLAVADSRAYWTNVDPSIPKDRLAVAAFENRWFGDRAMPRIQRMVADLRDRYDAFPPALEVLRQWRPDDPITIRNLCHWHLQLSDPMYRDFTGTFLVERRRHPSPRIDRDATVRWLRDRVGDRWAVATLQKIARNLITAASEAGLCTAGRKERIPVYPPVSDVALTYLLYLLRQTRFRGTLLDNPYLISLGLAGGDLEKRVRRLDGVAFNRMGDLESFEWVFEDLEAWAERNMFSDKADTPYRKMNRLEEYS